ncbi:MAG: EAL domain-containing protein [Devosia sp.]
MPPKPGSSTRWQYIASVAVPVVTSVLFAAAAVIGFGLWSAQSIDARNLERQTALAGHVIATQVARLPHEQESVTIWDDSIVHTKPSLDAHWVDVNLGIWMADFFGHDQVVVLDDHDTPIYAMKHGEQVETTSVASELPEIMPLISALRLKMAQGELDAYSEGRADTPPRVSDLVVVAGVPSIVSVTPIISDSGEIAQVPGTEYLHVSMVHLDAEFAAWLSQEYMIATPAFTTLAAAGSDRSQLPLTNASGRFITFFEWGLNNPGQALVQQTAPVLAVAFLIAGLIVFILLDKLWRKSLALETGREDAEHRSRHDALTGLPNRSSFDTELARSLTLGRPREKRVSALLLDLDRFKQINDTLGHQAGDDLIEAVGQRLRQLIGPNDTLARLGGDEFAIVYHHGPGLSEPLTLGHRIIEALGKSFELLGSEAFIGVSIGVAVAEPGDTEARELVRRADIALFEAKATGRNRVVIFEEQMSELLQNRHVIEADLREALRRDDQLSVAFQPLYAAHSLKVTGAEALVRWNHPKLGHISPAHFIPVAESSGLIEAVGEFVLERACKLGAKWPGMTVAVNISPTQLRNRNFTEKVLAVLRQTGMRPEDLELEITENILLEDAHAASEAIHVFRAEGVQIALDDFGTGYSSLNYLKRYPVDRIKIDRSFVSQLAPGGVSVAIVEAMVKLAHALKIEVTAEGVETEEQRLLLVQLGCNILQGYLLSPPITQTSIEALLRAARDVPTARVA